MLPVAAIFLILSSCARPDNRTFEDGWLVVSNVCEDVSVTIRTKVIEGLQANRQIIFRDKQGRNIYKTDLVATRATRGVPTITVTTFENSAENEIIDTKKISRQQTNQDFQEAYDRFHGQQDKHKELDALCLNRGAAQV